MQPSHTCQWVEVRRAPHIEFVMGSERHYVIRVTYRCACGRTKQENEEWPA